jgi:molybdopterin synthase sulfur carrier subunit
MSCSRAGREEKRMEVLVRIPTPLRTVTKGAAEVHSAGDSVAGVIDDLERQFPGMRERLLEANGAVRRFINLYVNEEDIRFLDGVKTSLKAGDQVSIVPAIAGGS